ncbi:hypothetical protein L6164_016105 [Bauhinia variegata]|uniref:Uncharacterized protein n=1 Tax=Bauhinia variegata TaxID=167791 RepID=A0ACB9NMP2_BAUVA|nr:hypothetical protein L6164_016105 [Bauhinia variegata]
MLLGKRPRPPMKRTTSMSEISFDLNRTGDAPVAVDPNNRGEGGVNGPWKQTGGGGGRSGLNSNYNNGLVDQIPRNSRRHSADFLETADFLKTCGFCKRRLVPSRDIYMYRGDTAFCSLECRQQQMTQDERKDKCCVASKKRVQAVMQAATSGSQATATATNKGETLVAL